MRSSGFEKFSGAMIESMRGKRDLVVGDVGQTPALGEVSACKPADMFNRLDPAWTEARMAEAMQKSAAGQPMR